MRGTTPYIPPCPYCGLQGWGNNHKSKCEENYKKSLLEKGI